MEKVICTIDGQRRDLELEPVSHCVSTGWYGYRTADHFMVIQLPYTPERMRTVRCMIRVSGLAIELGATYVH